MPNNRYFVPQSFTCDQEVELTSQEFHHLRNVCRGQCGDEIELINGKGELACAAVSHLTKEKAIARVTSVHKEDPLPFTITLALAFLKPSHLEYAIEKATEVGVSTFWLFPGDKSEKKQVSEQYLKRLETILLGATKQCGRLFAPTLEIKKSLRECSDPSHRLLFGDLNSQTIPLSQATNLGTNVCLVIGPESGFSENERKILLGMKAVAVSMHPNTFRAETAAVAGPLLLFNRLYS